MKNQLQFQIRLKVCLKFSETRLANIEKIVEKINGFEKYRSMILIMILLSYQS